MPLQIRRGTDAERLGSFTPAEGELIYTTDTKKLYVGDGITPGGVAIDTVGSGGGGASTLNDLTDVNAGGAANGSILKYNGSSWAISTDDTVLFQDTAPTLGGNLNLNNYNITGPGNLYIQGDVFANITYSDTDGNHFGDVIADDSTTKLVDATLQQFTGSLEGNVTGNVTGDLIGDVTGTVTGDLIGDVTGNVIGDVVGSIFADDSSMVIDGLTGSGYFNNIISTNPRLNIGRPSGITELRLESYQTRNRFNINTVDKEGDLSGYTGYYGTLNFGFQDSTTDRADATIRGAASDMRLAHDTVTTFISDETKYFTLKEGDFGFGTYTPEAKLDVRGAIMPGRYVDTTARDADIATPVAGMIVFVTDGDGAGNAKFQGYDGTSWVDLN